MVDKGLYKVVSSLRMPPHLASCYELHSNLGTSSIAPGYNSSVARYLCSGGVPQKSGLDQSSATSSQDVHVSESSANANILEPSRTIKASHATSDAPDPSIIQEPELLKSLENSIAGPHAAGADQIPEVDIATIPERVGYLKEVCGIDFGWGTTSLFQWLVEDIHIYAGLPWAASFTLLLVIGRLLMLRAAIRGQEMAAKIRELNPILTPLREEYKQAANAGDKLKLQSSANQIRAITRDSGVSMFAAFKPILYQIPLSFGGYRLGHAMGSLPVPSLETESFIWFSNLSTSDPYVLPLFTAVLSYLALSRGIKQAVLSGQPNQFQNALVYVLPPVSFIFISWQPGIVQVFFAAQAMITFAQMTAFTSPASRRWLKLPPLQKVSGPTPTSTFSSSSTAATAPQQRPGTTQIAGMTIQSHAIAGTATAADSSIANPATPQNISMIDKVLNKVNSYRDSATKIAKNSTAGRVAKKKKEAAMQKADKYEYKRRQDAQVEREWRNESIREGRKIKSEE